MLLKISDPPSRSRASGIMLLERRGVNSTRTGIFPTAPAGLLLRRVALLIETSGSYGRGLLRGVARYNREHLGWSTCFHPHGLGGESPAWLKSWRGDGVLARVETREVADLLARLDIPVVNLRRTLPWLPFAYVGPMHDRIALLAAQHLIERGLVNFAFVGPRAGEHSDLDERRRSFQARISAIGRVCHVYPEEHLPGIPTWDRQQNQLARWIGALPKPLGLMAYNDERGLHVLDACRRCGAIVPDEVAVIGVDDDEHLCGLAIPPLSSVDVNAPGIGYTAAATLDRLMRGQRNVPRAQYIPPRAVITRMSTNTIATDDEEVSRALRYIHAHCGERLRISSVLRHVQLSHTTMQKRMKKTTGRSIHAEIRLARLARAKYLLLTTDQSLDQISIVTGFSSVQYLTRVFRRAYGQTPGGFRNRSALYSSNISETADRNERRRV